MANYNAVFMTSDFRVKNQRKFKAWVKEWELEHALYEDSSGSWE